MKKIVAICSFVILALFSVGCGKVIELTDDENDLIAEYAAELLIKYDRNMDSKYYESLNDTEEISTSEEELLSSEETTETTETEMPDTEATGTDVSSQQETEAPLAPEEGGDGVVATKDRDFDIAEFAGYTGVSIKYSYYMVLDKYPSYDSEGVYMEIEAPSGYQLLVLKFNVENITNEEQKIDLYTKDINYRAFLGNSRGIKQMLTLLMDDLYTCQTTLGANQLEEMVLLFQIPDSVTEEIQDLKLQIKIGEEKAVLQLE